MFKIRYFLNPKRRFNQSLRLKIVYYLRLPFIHFGLWLNFNNSEYSYVHGLSSRVVLGKNCSTMDTIFNVISGEIVVGDNTIFGHGCMVLTGTHNFYNGIRGSLNCPVVEETPQNGRDISIGSGCFIGSGVIIQGNISIGDNVLIGAGSVVTKNIPSNCFVAGAPAKIIYEFN